jgi:hypothetical protein
VPAIAGSRVTGGRDWPTNFRLAPHRQRHIVGYAMEEPEPLVAYS